MSSEPVPFRFQGQTRWLRFREGKGHPNWREGPRAGCPGNRVTKFGRRFIKLKVPNFSDEFHQLGLDLGGASQRYSSALNDFCREVPFSTALNFRLWFWLDFFLHTRT